MRNRQNLKISMPMAGMGEKFHFLQADGTDEGPCRVGPKVCREFRRAGGVSELIHALRAAIVKGIGSARP